MKSTFFNIRKIVAGKSQPVRYLGYAAGEIALIIVGILLAVQINDWNDERKYRNECLDNILKLKLDINEAIANVQGSIERMEEWNDEIANIASFLASKTYDLAEQTAFENALNNIAALNLPKVDVGLLGSVLDGETELIAYDQDLVEQALEIESFINSRQSNIQNNVDRIELIVGNTLSQFVGFGQTGAKIKPLYDTNILKSSKEFSYSVHSIKSMRARIISFNKGIVEELEKFGSVVKSYE